MIRTQFLDISFPMYGWHLKWCFQPSVVGTKKIPHHHLNLWLMSSISNVLEQQLLYQRYTGLHERSMLSQTFYVDPYAHGTIEDMESIIVQIMSLLAHNSHNYQNHKSLELGVVVKRVVLAFVVLFCFVFVIHLLFSKGVTHLHTLLL